MADELDLRVLPAATRDFLSISLGAAWKSFGAATKPLQSLPAVYDTAKQLVTIPDDAEGGLRQKAEALAGVWMDKGMTLLNDCKVAGEKFTEGK